ncbi:MAG TPA: OsmC family protein [Bacteroidales bacterium]|nr:OsmC family protein [Bacteroidales bacterium]
MSEKVSLNWLEDMTFEANVNGHQIVMDALESAGGHDRGPRPKPLVLAALAGCTAMDVISILNKMHVSPQNFRIEVEAEVTQEHPKVYHTIKLIYIFKGQNLPIDKLQKAIDLSQERYCGVSAMLRKAANISYEMRIED